MGHIAASTLIVVGLARLPQPSVAAEQTVAVELEIELPTHRILAANSTLQLPGLARMLRETLTGKCLNSACEALFELEIRYSAPFTNALCTAIKRALQRASTDISPDVPAAPPANGSAAAPVRSRQATLAKELA